MIASPDLEQTLRMMDVADEMRRQRHSIEEHLEASDRDAIRARLLERYREMGHAAEPQLLDEAINTVLVQQHRFRPPPSGLGLRLATWYVRRGALTRRFGVPLVVLLLLAAVSATLLVGVRSFRAGRETSRQQRVEALADRAAALLADIRTVAREAEAATLAEAHFADARRARQAGDGAGVEQATMRLSELLARLGQEYTLTITLGRERDGLRHYLIVQARGPDQRLVPVQIRDEESGDLSRVTEWGERVTRAIYDQVAADYADNQIIDDNVLGQKQRGFLEPSRRHPSVGQITQW